VPQGGLAWSLDGIKLWVNKLDEKIVLEPAIAFVLATASYQSTIAYGEGNRFFMGWWRCDEGNRICLCWSRRSLFNL
jgi:hypothetical protein